jgi:hypothetical protein
MRNKAFSTIEILIAFSIMTTTLVAVVLISYGTPVALNNAELEYTAHTKARALLEKAQVRSDSNFSSVQSFSTTTDGVYDTSLSIESIEDDFVSTLYVHVGWVDVRREHRYLTQTTIATDFLHAGDISCSPFISGDWKHIQLVKTYTVTPGDLLPSGSLSGSYVIGDIISMKNILAVTMASTTSASSSTLYFFTILDDSVTLLPLGNSFDNAPVSKVGFSALTVGSGYLFGGNGFGSASTQTCNTSHNCAQLQIYDPSSSIGPRYISSLTLSTTSPPYAETTGGITATAQSIMYKNGFIYLGLVKTAHGSEFNIIDVRDVENPRWIGGYNVGRGVNEIVIRGTRAYLGTDDPLRELLILDISDPLHILPIGSFNAQGATGFGLGNSLIVKGPHTYLGRTYVANAPEFITLDTSSSTNILQKGSFDLGTFIRPQSIRGSIHKDFLTFLLVDSGLQILDMKNIVSPTLYSSYSALPASSKAYAFACKQNTFYVGSYDQSASKGYLQIITTQ